MALKSLYRVCEIKKLDLISSFSVRSQNHSYKNIIVFRLARHLCSSTLTSLFICYMFGRTYVILYFDPHVFVLVMWSTPSQIALTESSGLSISTRITLEIELFTVLNSFAGAVKT